ncbi:MAG: crossover junction endodeoxyribonuclease RuvC [Candidatus Marinimicrobia bacterium]|nr:crossover junction endodeoxyribonuclease RuvC [Candidatus Neomarinimicrobiota bacterium]
MIILGIDPGLSKMGFGVIKINDEQPSLIDFGIISTTADQPLEKRLKTIYLDLKTVIKEYQPKAMSVEGSFFGKNVRSMMMLGHARGMALLGAAQAGIPVYEYSPRKIKQSVTGNGNATKEQVKYMVQIILGLKEKKIPDDASDALAIALCHTKQFRYDD